MPEKQYLKCQHCGHWGEDVEISYEHVGGQGDCVPVVHCVNIVECWERHDQAHGVLYIDSTINGEGVTYTYLN